MGSDDEMKPRERVPTTAERAADLMQRAIREKAKVPPRQRLEVFVLRASDKSYIWEIRRNGATVVHGSVDIFPSPTLARAAGEAAMAQI